MASTVLIRYGEIALKGKNRPNFEKKLADNIGAAVKCTVKKTSGRLIARIDDRKDAAKLKRVFGIISYSIAEESPLDIDEINKNALEQARKKRFSTFRITVQRSQKRLKPSPELEKEIGAYIVEKTGKKVKLRDPELEIFVEIAERAYIFTRKIKCFGGLPVGIEGRVALLFEKDADVKKTILAGLLMMRRGCDVFPFFIGSKNTQKEISLLEAYGAKKAAAAGSPEEAVRAAERLGCRAIAVGQTLEDINDLGQGITILRPIISFSENEITKKLEEFKSE